MFSKDFVQGLESVTVNMAQDKQLAYHKKHIQVLWNHIERLEELISIQAVRSPSNVAMPPSS